MTSRESALRTQRLIDSAARSLQSTHMLETAEHVMRRLDALGRLLAGHHLTIAIGGSGQQDGPADVAMVPAFHDVEGAGVSAASRPPGDVARAQAPTAGDHDPGVPDPDDGRAPDVAQPPPTRYARTTGTRRSRDDDASDGPARSRPRRSQQVRLVGSSPGQEDARRAAPPDDRGRPADGENPESPITPTGGLAARLQAARRPAGPAAHVAGVEPSAPPLPGAIDAHRAVLQRRQHDEHTTLPKTDDAPPMRTDDAPPMRPEAEPAEIGPPSGTPSMSLQPRPLRSAPPRAPNGRAHTERGVDASGTVSSPFSGSAAQLGSAPSDRADAEGDEGQPGRRRRFRADPDAAQAGSRRDLDVGTEPDPPADDELDRLADQLERVIRRDVRRHGIDL